MTRVEWQVSRQCLVHTRHGDDWNKVPHLKKALGVCQVYLKGAKLGEVAWQPRRIDEAEGSYGEVFLALHASLGRGLKCTLWLDAAASVSFTMSLSCRDQRAFKRGVARVVKSVWHSAVNGRAKQLGR